MAISPDQVVTLPDGRSLGYAEYGDPEGLPVLLFHGTPASRVGLLGPAEDQAAERLGVRVLAVERPGHGLSEPKPDRTILDWPVDVVGFATALKLSRFNVLGVSGGGPYAAACAYRIPHRLWAAGIVSGAPPVDAPGAVEGISGRLRTALFLGRWLPWALRIGVRRFEADVVSKPGTMMDRLLAELPPVDRQTLADHARRERMLGMIREAFRRGPEGPFLDLKLLSRPWGFSVADIPMVVNLWFGGQARNTPPAAGHYLARTLARSEARFYPEEGHVSLFTNRLEEILTGLLETARREEGKPVG